MMSSTPTNDIAFQSLRLAASSANLLSPQRSNNHNHVGGENFMSPMPPPSMPPLSSLQVTRKFFLKDFLFRDPENLRMIVN